MTTELLRIKIAAPVVRTVLVPRPQLIGRLGEARDRRLSVVTAGAGCGKTTLVREWLRTAQLPFAWLTVDEGDNDPARFFAYLVAALRHIDAAIGQSAWPMLESMPPPSTQAIATSLLNDLAAVTRPFALVLDDYHHIHNPAIHEQMAYFVEHLPDQMHLIVVSRQEPPLPLSRLRAANQALEIRQHELSFSRDEAEDFLRRVMRLDLSPADVAVLHRRTEGWVAGLQLAALSLRGSQDRHRLVTSFAGTNRYVIDYFVEEVLERQTLGVREFLLRTSILDRLCAPLCDYVATRRDSAQVLHGLEQANVFMVPLDDVGCWFRYHHLFADLLRHQLRTTGREDVAALHKRASDWFAANDLLHEAVRHALVAGDWPRAATLIESAYGVVRQRGYLATLIGWCKQLPEAVIHASPKLCLAYAQSLLLVGQRRPAISLLDHAEACADADPQLAGAVAAAKAFLAEARGDYQAMIAQSERALVLLPEDDASNRNSAASSLGRAYWLSGRLVEADTTLREAVRVARQTRSHHSRVVEEMVLARIMAARGRLRQAAALLNRLVAEGFRFPVLARVHVELAFLCYEWNDLQECEHHIDQCLSLGRQFAGVDFLEVGYRLQAQLRLAQGDLPAALAAVERWQQLGREREIAAVSLARFAAFQVQLSIAQGDLPAARQFAEAAGERLDCHAFYPFLSLTKARLLLAQGAKAAAAEELRVRIACAAAGGWVYGLLAARVLLAVASERQGEGLNCLVEALRVGQPERFMRSFVDVGAPLAPLLRETALQGVAPRYVRQILATIAAETRSRLSGVSSLTEAPSEREMEVLRLLAGGLSNQQIADRLSVSLSTAKTHVHNLYGKLSTRNRAEVVSRATELGLL